MLLLLLAVQDEMDFLPTEKGQNSIFAQETMNDRKVH